MLEGFEIFDEPAEPELCSICGHDETHIWHGEPEQPTVDDLLLCDSCFGWSKRMTIGL